MYVLENRINLVPCKCYQRAEGHRIKYIVLLIHCGFLLFLSNDIIKNINIKKFLFLYLENWTQQ